MTSIPPLNHPNDQLEFESLSKPPSSVLEDGRFVYLPPLNQNTFFSRSVAKFNLVNAEGSTSTTSSSSPYSTDDNSHKKVSVDNDNNMDVDVNDSSLDSNQNQVSKDTSTSSSSSSPPQIHPIQIASARIHTLGISELSKVINLSSLIQSNEYFGLTSVFDKSTLMNNNKNNNNDPVSSTSSTSIPPTKSTETTSTKIQSSVRNNDGTTNKLLISSNDTNTKNITKNEKDIIVQQKDEEKTTQMKEQILRSEYILKRKQLQYESSYTSLQSHYKRLKVLTTTQHTLDTRLLELRKRWRLNVPNHGVHVQYPIQPTDVIAVDVDIYASRNDEEEVYYIGSKSNDKNSRKAKVPRFATIELSNDYNIQEQMKRRHSHHHHHHKRHHSHSHDHHDNHIQEEKIKDHNQAQKQDFDGHHTVAQPFLITESTSSSLFDNFNSSNNSNSNLPMLTLVFQIEKSSTGFKQSVALSSNSEISSLTSSSSSSSLTKAENNDEVDTIEKEQNVTQSIIRNKTKLQKDELYIQSLQHSLFCSNIFDIIRQEIIGEPNPSSNQVQSRQAQKHNNSRNSVSTKGGLSTGVANQQITWLSSEMEDSFLPSPSLMAGFSSIQRNTEDGDILNRPNSQPQISVIYCHEGEVKVQLDSEYAFSVKLVDINNQDIDNQSCKSGEDNGSKCDSGSQSPEQLNILCRLLLLQAQYVYHENRKAQIQKLNEAREAQRKNNDDTSNMNTRVDYSAGIKRKGQTAKENQSNQKLQLSAMSPPHILQSCVLLGKKFILEKKIRNALKVSFLYVSCDLSIWVQNH